VPAGLGVQIATGKRPLILVGDGAFQMTGWELGNCRRYGLDPIVILFNNLGCKFFWYFNPNHILTIWAIGGSLTWPRAWVEKGSA